MNFLVLVLSCLFAVSLSVFMPTHSLKDGRRLTHGAGKPTNTTNSTATQYRDKFFTPTKSLRDNLFPMDVGETEQRRKSQSRKQQHNFMRNESTPSGLNATKNENRTTGDVNDSSLVYQPAYYITFSL
jgi:hypothetical protein